MKFNLIIFIAIYFILCIKNQLTLGRGLKNNRYNIIEYNSNNNISIYNNHYPYLSIVNNKRIKRYEKYGSIDNDTKNLEQTSTSQVLENGARTKILAVSETVVPTTTTTTEKLYESDLRAILWSSTHDIYKPIRSKVEHKRIISKINIKNLMKISLNEHDVQTSSITTSKIISKNNEPINGLQDNITKKINHNNDTLFEKYNSVENAKMKNDLNSTNNSLIKLETESSNTIQIIDNTKTNTTKKSIPLHEPKFNEIIRMRNTLHPQNTNQSGHENSINYPIMAVSTSNLEHHQNCTDGNKDNADENITPTTYRNAAMSTNMVNKLNQTKEKNR